MVGETELACIIAHSLCRLRMRAWTFVLAWALIRKLSVNMSVDVPEWCVRTLSRLAEELSEFGDRSDLLDAQRVQLELLFRELVAVEESGGVASRATDLVRKALSIIRDVAARGKTLTAGIKL